MLRRIILGISIFLTMTIVFFLFLKEIRKIDIRESREKHDFVSNLNYSFSCIPIQKKQLRQQFGKSIITCELKNVLYFDFNIEASLQDSLKSHKFLKFIVSNTPNQISFLLAGNFELKNVDSIQIISDQNQILIYEAESITKSSITNNLYWEVYDLTKLKN